MINKIPGPHLLIKRTSFDRFSQLFKLVNGKKSYELIADLHFINIYLSVPILVEWVEIAKFQIFINVPGNRIKLQVAWVIYIIKAALYADFKFLLPLVLFKVFGGFDGFFKRVLKSLVYCFTALIKNKEYERVMVVILSPQKMLFRYLLKERSWRHRGWIKFLLEI